MNAMKSIHGINVHMQSSMLEEWTLLSPEMAAGCLFLRQCSFLSYIRRLNPEAVTMHTREKKCSVGLFSFLLLYVKQI